MTTSHPESNESKVSAMVDKLDGPMDSEEFLERVRALLDLLESMRASGGGYLPDIIMTGDAMEALADRWYRCDVKARLAALTSAEKRIEELSATLRSIELAVYEGHDPRMAWTANLPEMIRQQRRFSTSRAHRERIETLEKDLENERLIAATFSRRITDLEKDLEEARNRRSGDRNDLPEPPQRAPIGPPAPRKPKVIGG